MTYLQIVNSVMRMLRETEVTTVAESSYSKLIGTFVQQVIDEMWESWNWNRLLRAVDGTIAAGLSTLDLTADNLANLSRATNEKSFLAYDYQRLPMVYDITSGEERRLVQTNRTKYNRDYALSTRPVQPPSEFIIDQSNDEGWNLIFDTTMDKERTIRSYWYIPDDDLDPTSSDDDSTQVKMPSRPIILGAVYYALNERGEEIGEPGQIAERRWREALAAAIERDDQEKQDFLYRNFTNDERS